MLKLGRFTQGLRDLFRRSVPVDPALFEALENQLLASDVGVETTDFIIQQLHALQKREGLTDSEALRAGLKSLLVEMLTLCEKPFSTQSSEKPFSILVVGVNGVGKTTTIAKLARKCQQSGQRVILAAGDTFRAAAVDQLKQWGSRFDIPVVSQQAGADSAAVIFDTLQSAKAQQFDVVFADTAGRMHNQGHLLEELKKVKRVMTKADAHAPHEVLLVLDAGTGQNALQQAKQFHQAVGVTGIVMTKLDGTAKGGIIFTIARELKLPLWFIGVGERVEDLQPFHAKEFVEALLSEE